jgi:predicted PurR-regulated permease PerM
MGAFEGWGSGFGSSMKLGADPKKKQVIMFVVIICIIFLVVAILFSKNAFGSSDTDALIPLIQAQSLYCAENVQAIQIQQNNTLVEMRNVQNQIGSFATGEKFLIVASLFTSAVLNVLLLYLFLKHKFELKSRG